MTRIEFMAMLENALGNIDPAAKEEIMYDYKEHFEIGLEQGKYEKEICSALGDPKTIAKQYRAEYMVIQADTDKSATNMLKALFASMSLGFFNIIVMLPILAVFTVVSAGFFAVSLALVLSGIIIFLATLLKPIIPYWVTLPAINPVILILFSISLVSFGFLLGLGLVQLAKLSYGLFINYVKTNIRIIAKQESESENNV